MNKLLKAQFWTCLATSISWLLAFAFGCASGDDAVFYKFMLAAAFAVSALLSWEQIKSQERGGAMDELFQWKPRDNQHLIAKVEKVEMMPGMFGERVGRCRLCDSLAVKGARYCDMCGARLDWKEFSK